MPLRILSPQCGLSPESNLGGEVYDRELIRAMTRQAAPVEVLLPEGAGCIEAENLTVHRAPRAWRYTYEYNWRWRKPLARRVAAFRPDILRCHSPYALGWVCRRTGRKLGVPVVAHYHHLTGERQHDWIDRVLARTFDAIVTGSRFTAEALAARYGVPERRLHVAPYGVAWADPDPARVRQSRRKWVDDEERLVLTLSQLTERKNIRAAIEALARLAPDGSDAVLVIAGKGPERSNLEAAARRLGIGDRVRFAGFVDEDEKAALLTAADVFLFPSLLEGFGLAVAEAMAHGAAVVAANRSAIPEVVQDGKTGLLVDPESPESIAAALSTLLSDTDLRRTLAVAAREHARREFGWPAVAKRVLDIYAAVASESRRS